MLAARIVGSAADATCACASAARLAFVTQYTPEALLCESVNLQVNPAEEKLARWTRCSLSGEPLSPPCCIDELGAVYNKDAVVAALLKKVRLLCI